MKIKKHILIPLMVLLLLGSMDAMAAIEQAIQVKGKVIDNIGEPVIGANVVVKVKAAKASISPKVVEAA